MLAFTNSLSAFSQLSCPNIESSTIISKNSDKGPSPSFFPTIDEVSLMEIFFSNNIDCFPICFAIILPLFEYIIKNTYNHRC